LILTRWGNEHTTTPDPFSPTQGAMDNRNQAGAKTGPPQVPGTTAAGQKAFSDYKGPVPIDPKAKPYPLPVRPRWP
jgi:hypothetical protein